MEYIISAVWIILELICFSTFCSAFLFKTANVRKSVVFNTIAFCVMYAFTNIVFMAPLKQVVNIVAYICLSFCLYRGHWLKHMLIVILLFVFAAAIDTIMLYGASVVFGIGYDELVWKKLTYTTIVTVGKLIEVLIAYIVYYLRSSSQKQYIKGKWLGLLLLFPTVSLIVMIVLFCNFTLQDDMPIGAVLLCVVLGLTNIANVYLVRNMEHSAQKEQEMLLVNQQMEIQTQSFVELEKQYKSQRQAAHEHQRHLQTIHDLISSDEILAVQRYIEELRGKHATRLCAINSHHPIIDAVLNHKYQMAKECLIEMQVQVNDLSNVKMSANELVVLLSNILDNAIEACEKITEKRLIHCQILLNENLFISVRNTSLPVEIIDGVIQTSKPKKKDHGFGLIGIRHVLDKNQAEYTYHYDCGWFQFVAEIPNNNDSN